MSEKIKETLLVDIEKPEGNHCVAFINDNSIYEYDVLTSDEVLICSKLFGGLNTLFPIEELEKNDKFCDFVCILDWDILKTEKINDYYIPICSCGKYKRIKK